MNTANIFSWNFKCILYISKIVACNTAIVNIKPTTIAAESLTCVNHTSSNVSNDNAVKVKRYNL